MTTKTETTFQPKANTIEQAEALIVPMLGADLPDVLTIMNSPSICEACELGRNIDAYELPESETPTEATYDIYKSAAESLCEKGDIISYDFCGIKSYALSPEKQKLYK